MHRMICILVLLGIFGTFSVANRSQISVAANDDDFKASGVVRALRQKRIDILQKNVEAIEMQHSSGTVPLDALLDAKMLHLEAMVDNAQSVNERFALLTRLLETAKMAEDRIAELQRIGAEGGSASALYLAQAATLDVEIRIAQTRSR